MAVENIPANEIEGDDPAPDSLPSIEAKYREQMRQIVTQKIDLPVSALLSMMKEQIKLNPEFQRRDRWDEKRQSRLIESLVMNVPIPPVFLGEDEYGHYIVLDGRQRLTAVKRFLENSLELSDLNVWEELNGKSYQDLVKRGEDKYLIRRFIPAVVILKESSALVKYDVFDRLNTGGVRANEMEIRNAVYRGPFTEALHSLSRVQEFCELWGIPVDEIAAAESSKLYKQMDDLELVLRFFALSEYDSMNVRFRDYLSEFMAERNIRYGINPELVQADRERFVRAIQNSRRVFGVLAFNRPTGRKSIPLSDAVMIALADIDPQAITDEKAARIATATAALFGNEEFARSIGTGTNGRGAIANRILLAKQAVTGAMA